MAKAKKVKSKTKEKSTKKKKPTIKAYVLELFTNKPSIKTKEMVEKVISKFPDSAFNKTHVAYYGNMMRKSPYDIDIPKKAKKKCPN